MPPTDVVPPEYDDELLFDTTPTPFQLPPIDSERPSDPLLDDSPAYEPSAPVHAPPEPSTPVHAPPGYTGPLQFIFTSQDVLNSPVIQVHSSKQVYTVQSSALASITSIKNEDGGPVADIIWSADAEPQLNLDFKGKTVPLKNFMYRSKKSDVLFEVRYFHHTFEVYKAGPALGIRFIKTKTMLAGIRDPYKNVELVIAPEGMEDGAVLPASVIIAVLLKSGKSLGKNFEQRNVKDKVWGGLDYMFRAVGRDTVLDMGPSAGVGRDYHPNRK
ncbi:hypothetical protein CALVIDRAFT_557686 [Calocera viscosa TUFC12733]|uniref:Uncharacterized protein n=1 Tax=Calocera viscosa (strain TUFC12733) TaxID=1330018 RepID=A0A167I567_CALVF|nr:hypothetical protein CALVIDRAFT_557686 [Calocera viscosa TUFC12733]